MKLSLKLQDDHQQQHSQRPPLLKAKIPITIFNQPFTSSLTTAVTTTTTTTTTTSTTLTTTTFPQYPFFSLSSNFSSGPSFALTYSPLSSSPFSLSLKSGLGLFGSPHHSPFVISAHFSLSSTNPSAISPMFLLHFKPQFGHFSLHKTTSSANPNPRVYGSHSVSEANLQSGSPSNSEFASGSVSKDPLGWQDVKLEPCSASENGFASSNPSFFNGVDSSDGIGFVKERVLALNDGKRGDLLRGIAVKAKTVLPVTKRVKVNLRWGVNFPTNSEVKMPYLTVNKIGIERVQKVEEVKKMNFENNAGDLELLKGMCFWMRRDLELLEKENRDMKQCLEEMRMGVSTRSYRGVSDSIGKKVFPSSSESFGEARSFSRVSDNAEKAVFPSSSENFGEFERRRSKKNGGGNGQTEVKKSVNQANDLESELQKAIMAAASS